ncbi:response regulator [Aliiglaciecola sp.]|nr:response regulator [Aliiglaciecola sp.]
MVDDQQMVCETGTLLLQNIGYQVVSFTDPLKALEFVREQQQPFDLLISDYSMPELDGVTLINKVRDVYPDIPAVLCSGDIDSQSKLTKSAINKVLSKPYGLAEISQVIDQMLKN